jgi:hypothetical protein
MCSTISQDNTLGENARKSKLLAEYGQRLQRPAFSAFAEKQLHEPQEDIPPLSPLSEEAERRKQAFIRAQDREIRRRRPVRLIPNDTNYKGRLDYTSNGRAEVYA